MQQIMSKPDEKSPFDKGYQAFAQNVSAPAYPTSDSPWSARLYNRGWEAARRDAAVQLQARSAFVRVSRVSK